MSDIPPDRVPPREPVPTPRDPVPPRRPIYYPTGWGCAFWIVALIMLYIVVGLIFAPMWYPWWW